MESPGCVCAEAVRDWMTRDGGGAAKPTVEPHRGKHPGLFCLQMGFPLQNSAFDPLSSSTFHWLSLESWVVVSPWAFSMSNTCMSYPSRLEASCQMTRHLRAGIIGLSIWWARALSARQRLCLETFISNNGPNLDWLQRSLSWQTYTHAGKYFGSRS